MFFLNFWGTSKFEVVAKHNCYNKSSQYFAYGKHNSTQEYRGRRKNWSLNIKTNIKNYAISKRYRRLTFFYYKKNNIIYVILFNKEGKSLSTIERFKRDLK